MNFNSSCEEIINKQINQELMASYVYMALYSYFGNTKVAYKNIQNYFKKNSEEEREHAIQFINYINMRGGTVNLKPINIPTIDYSILSMKDAFETALELENLVTKNLLAIHQEANENNDVQLCTFIEDKFLNEQYESLKILGDIITNVSRCKSEFELFMFDKEFNY